MQRATAIILSTLAASLYVSADATSLDAASLADGCTSCHGLNGRSIGRIPSLAGADRALLAAKLKAFRSQTTEATIMNRLARSYSDAEIDALADYFSSIGKP